MATTRVFNSTRVVTDLNSVAMKVRPFMVVVMDPEGVRHGYLFEARSRRQAEHDAREWVAVSGWATLVGVTPIVDEGSRPTGRRLLAVAALTFAISTTTIASTMLIGLSLEGAI